MSSGPRTQLTRRAKHDHDVLAALHARDILVGKRRIRRALARAFRWPRRAGAT
ncbi:hypothetical protein A7982_12892 [Minicystis rosea]|nr:hypothetical protein A7982_12892 [Minicystis rosea]